MWKYNLKNNSLTFMGFTGLDHVHDCTDHPIKVKKMKENLGWNKY